MAAKGIPRLKLFKFNQHWLQLPLHGFFLRHDLLATCLHPLFRGQNDSHPLPHLTNTCLDLRLLPLQWLRTMCRLCCNTSPASRAFATVSFAACSKSTQHFANRSFSAASRASFSLQIIEPTSPRWSRLRGHHFASSIYNQPLHIVSCCVLFSNSAPCNSVCSFPLHLSQPFPLYHILYG